MSNAESCRASHPALLMIGIAALAAMPALFAAGVQPFAIATTTCLHIIRLCLAAFTPLDSLLHTIPTALIVAGLLRAVWRRLATLRRSTVVIRRIPWRQTHDGDVLHRLARLHGVQQNIRIMLGSPPNPAFTAGLISPRIYLGEPLQRSLTEKELEAVLLHEACHLQRRDPLRTFAAAFLADVFFWIPLVRNVMTALLARIEFAADDAGRRAGDTDLAGAILKLADRAPPLAIALASSFVSASLTQRRIERLLGAVEAEREPPPARRTLMASVFALAFVWLLAVTSSAAHAAHLPENHEHCPHSHALGVLHASTHVQHGELARR